MLKAFAIAFFLISTIFFAKKSKSKSKRRYLFFIFLTTTLILFVLTFVSKQQHTVILFARNYDHRNNECKQLFLLTFFIKVI